MRLAEVRSRGFAAVLAVLALLTAGVDLSAQPPAPVSKTGQDECWDANGDAIDCTGTGQDGEHQAGEVWPVPRFEDLGNGTVIDHLTGLVWLQDAGCFTGQIWIDAFGEIVALNTGQRTCANYTAGTHSDWRLPNAKEYASLWHYGESGPAMQDGHGFVNGPSGEYWSSTTSNRYPTRAWTGSSPIGEVFDENENKTLVKGIWAVRGPVEISPAPVPKTGQQDCWGADGFVISCAGTGQDGEIRAGVAWPDPRFTDQTNGTVLDNLTGLIWLQDADCVNWQNWTSALSEVAALNAGSRTCAGYTPGTFDDWRLANNREMLSLWDYGQDGPALPAVHPFVNVSVPGVSYWSSTTVAGAHAEAWKLKTYTGAAFTDPKSTFWKVWPVRGGILGTTIFTDGFESGDTSAWSSSVP